MRDKALRIAAAPRSRRQLNQPGLVDAPAAGHCRPQPKKRGFRFAVAAAPALLVGKALPTDLESRLAEVPLRMIHCSTTIVAD
jgi:hypothetical protein